MIGYDMERKVAERKTNAWTLELCEVIFLQDMTSDRYVLCFLSKYGEFKPDLPLCGEPMEFYDQDHYAGSGAAERFCCCMFSDSVTTSFLSNYDKPFRDGGVSDVVDAYEHALLASYPRARYLVGRDATHYKAPLAALPEWFSDWMLDNKNRPVPAACR